MGTVALQARGIDWKTELPLNISFALRLNLHATALERQIMLYAIEQSLMPGETGKRFELETAKEAGDELSAHFQDYDWADEVLHTQIGRRMLRRTASRETRRSRAPPRFTRRPGPRSTATARATRNGTGGRRSCGARWARRAATCGWARSGRASSPSDGAKYR
jgi:hypothetical protein